MTEEKTSPALMFILLMGVTLIILSYAQIRHGDSMASAEPFQSMSTIELAKNVSCPNLQFKDNQTYQISIHEKYWGGGEDIHYTIDGHENCTGVLIDGVDWNKPPNIFCEDGYRNETTGALMCPDERPECNSSMRGFVWVNETHELNKNMYGYDCGKPASMCIYEKGYTWINLTECTG